MKQLFTGAVLGTMIFASSAIANVDVSTTEPLSTSMMNTELNQVFDTNSLDQIQAMELSSQEMKDTQGAFVPLLALGILGGGAFSAWTNHGINYYQTGNFASVNSTLQATGFGMASGAVGGGAITAIRPFTGPMGAWVRKGDSYSKILKVETHSIRWGSNRHHQQQIGSARLRSVNNTLRNTKLPGSSWRVQDRGHFHLWKK